MSTPGGSIRSARTERTRHAIIEAACALFAERGYRATSLREIASAAGISHPALLNHFASREDVLSAVIAHYEDATRLDLGLTAPSDVHLAAHFAAIARHNQQMAGYLPLFTALLGEASAPRHPAHTTMRERTERLRRVGEHSLRAGIVHGSIAVGRDVTSETVRLNAGWDGAQLLAQYLPSRVSVPGVIERQVALLANPFGWRRGDQPEHAAQPSVPDRPHPTSLTAEDLAGYRVGRERRTRIVADAMDLFAREGYGDTSMRDIADRVGVSKAALFHHFPTKQSLLQAVLVERDRRVESAAGQVVAHSARERLDALTKGAGVSVQDEPGLIELYAVLSCESVPATQPGHAYFLERFSRLLEIVSATFHSAAASGELPPHRDPGHEAIWFLALWDGLQYQWLYDRASVDVASHLISHLDDVMPRSGGSTGEVSVAPPV